MVLTPIWLHSNHLYDNNLSIYIFGGILVPVSSAALHIGILDVLDKVSSLFQIYHHFAAKIKQKTLSLVTTYSLKSDSCGTVVGWTRRRQQSHPWNAGS